MMRRSVLVSLALLFSFQLYGWTHLGTNVFGWKNKTVTVYVNPTNCSIPADDLYSIVDSALQSWNAIPSSSLKLVRASTPATDTEAAFVAQTATQLPLIVCSDTLASFPDVDPDTILAFVPYFHSGADGYVTYSGMVLNSVPGKDSQLSYSNFTKSQIELVVGHELGHVLGLGHSSDADALMYFQLNKPFLLLTQDDQDGIAQLYPRNAVGDLLGCSAVHRKKTQVPKLGLILSFLTIALILVSGRVFFKTGPLREPEG